MSSHPTSLCGGYNWFGQPPISPYSIPSLHWVGCHLWSHLPAPPQAIGIFPPARPQTWIISLPSGYHQKHPQTESLPKNTVFFQKKKRRSCSFTAFFVHVHQKLFFESELEKVQCFLVNSKSQIRFWRSRKINNKKTSYDLRMCFRTKHLIVDWNNWMLKVM